MKIKRYEKCADCMSCVELFQNGIFYCNMRVNNPECSETHVSTCVVDPRIKPENCPWDKVADSLDSMG